MTNEFICKEYLASLFGYGHIALKQALVSHAQKKTLPIHGLNGGVTPMAVKFQENILPSLAFIFKNKIFLLARTRPTCYTHDVIFWTTIERDGKVIFQLDPRVSKRGFYKEYAYLHGWKNETSAKGTIIKTSCYDVDKDKGW